MITLRDRGAIVSTPYGLGKIIDGRLKSRVAGNEFDVLILGTEYVVKVYPVEMKKL